MDELRPAGLGSACEDDLRPPAERVVIEPEHRRDAIMDVIRSARREILLTLFRCDDFALLDELAAAHRQRGVRVRVLMTPKAKGWNQRLRELAVFLESMGAEVFRYEDDSVKYHAKYIVADDGPAMIGSLNFTRKCFTSTCDFLLVTHDPDVVSGLRRLFEMDCRNGAPDASRNFSERLIISPDHARLRLRALLEQATDRIGIIDHRVTDPDLTALLRRKRNDGVAVRVVGPGTVRGLAPHGKLMVIDDSAAVIGSLSMSEVSLDQRRELAVVVYGPESVTPLYDFFESALAAPSIPSVRADNDADDDE